MATNILFNDVPEESVARWSPIDGRAVIETSDGKVYSFDPSRPRGSRARVEPLGFHVGMWLQPAIAKQVGKAIEMRPAGKYPFAALEEYIEFRLRVTKALDYFLMSLDTDNEVSDRQYFAQKATHMLTEQVVREMVEPALMDNPMPAEFDPAHGPTEGEAGRILKAMIAKWRP